MIKFVKRSVSTRSWSWTGSRYEKQVPAMFLTDKPVPFPQIFLVRSLSKRHFYKKKFKRIKKPE